MSRLIDADKIDFNEVFIGASEFAKDTREAAQIKFDTEYFEVCGNIFDNADLLEVE